MSVRDSLTHGLSLDLVGPSHDGTQVAEILPLPPSRWYLTGFLAPWNAPSSQKRDEDDTQGGTRDGFLRRRPQFAAKAAWHRAQRALSLREKVRIVIELQQRAATTNPARVALGRPASPIMPWRTRP